MTISNSVHRAHALAKNSIYSLRWGMLSVAKGRECLVFLCYVMIIFVASSVFFSPVWYRVDNSFFLSWLMWKDRLLIETIQNTTQASITGLSWWTEGESNCPGPFTLAENSSPHRWFTSDQYQATEGNQRSVIPITAEACQAFQMRSPKMVLWLHSSVKILL